MSAPLLAPWNGISFDHYRHLVRVMRDNERVDPDWPALTLAHLFERGAMTLYAIASGAEAMGEFARRVKR